MRPFRKNSVTCSFWKPSVSRIRLVRAFPKFAHFAKKSTGKRSARRRCSLHRHLRSANLIELLVRIPFSASSLVPQSVCSGNWLELLVRVTCSAPFLTKFSRKHSARRGSNRSFPQENVLKSLVLDTGLALRLGDLNVSLSVAYLLVSLVNSTRLRSSQRDVDQQAPISLATALTANSHGATFDARVANCLVSLSLFFFFFFSLQD